MADSDGDTKAFESAQALFCAMADFLGQEKSKKVLNYKTYETYGQFKSEKGNEKQYARKHCHLGVRNHVCLTIHV